MIVHRSANPWANRQPLLSDEQQQNIETLIADIQASVDTSPADLDVSSLVTTVQEGVSDRTLTADEFEAILVEVAALGSALGITAEEARTLVYDLQTIAEASRLPRTDDSLTGTAEDDFLYGGLGNDTLTGAGSTTAGVGEVDWLLGGGGQDTFVLGNATTTFYNDGNATTTGINDAAIVLDFNPGQDVIQLYGSTSQYILGDIPASLGLTGTAIFYRSTGSFSTPELVGIVAGVSLTDFNTGFQPAA